MSAKQRSPLYHWEQEMIDSYHDYQWDFALKLEIRRDFLVDVIQVNKV